MSHLLRWFATADWLAPAMSSISEPYYRKACASTWRALYDDDNIVGTCRETCARRRAAGISPHSAAALPSGAHLQCTSGYAVGHEHLPNRHRQDSCGAIAA